MAMFSVAVRPFVMAVVGDVMLGRLVDTLFPASANLDREHEGQAQRLLQYHGRRDLIREFEENPYRAVWGNTLPLFHSADVRICNLETSVTDRGTKEPKEFNYRMHPQNLRALREVEMNYVSLANNHVLDFGVVGLRDTIEHVRNAGIAYAGVGENRDESQQPAHIQWHGKTISMFSFADHYARWAAGPAKPGINYIDVTSYTPQDISRIKDLVQEFAHDLIDGCGVDIIHGHSSHHVQGIEIYNGKPILYGCGDFLDDYATDKDYRNDLSFLYLLHYVWGNTPKTPPILEKIVLHPTQCRDFHVTADIAVKDREWLGQTMSHLCNQLGTQLTPQNDGTFVIFTNTHTTAG